MQPFLKNQAFFLLMLGLVGCSSGPRPDEYRFTSASVAPPLQASQSVASLAPTPSTSKTEDFEEEGLGEEDDFDAELDSFSAPTIDYAKADPLEKMNRFLYGVHRGVDGFVVRPIALTYSKFLPRPVQKGFKNFVRNLTAPVRALCHLLQGNLQEAGKTIGRFVMNSVVGVGGVVDVAAKMGAPETPTDFGATLKKWGVQPGPYIVIPGLGPTTFRGAFGALFDAFLDPVFLFTLNRDFPGNDRRQLMWGDTGVQLSSLLIARSSIDPIYEDLEHNAVDRYAKLRGIALQQGGNR